MATLLDQCEAVQENLERAHLANLLRQEQATLSKRSQEWALKKSRRQQLRLRVPLVTLDDSTSAELDAANSRVAPLAIRAAQRLVADGVRGLSQDTLWTELLAAAEAANAKTAEALCRAWLAWIDSLGEVTHPSALEKLILPTPVNRAALAEYRSAHARFKQLTRQDMAADETSMQAASDAMAVLREARARLSLSAPPEVRAFLDAVDAGGASLNLLVPTVLQWLAEHDDISRFAVRALKQ